MANGSVVVNVIDIGQGQCTFVEIRDTAGKLTNTLLFDCGSDSSSIMMATNLKYIADTYASMATPCFDAVFFSHSDKDHTNQFKPLLELIRSGGNTPLIKKLFFAGAKSDYTKSGFNILSYLLMPPAYMDAADMIPIKDDGTDFDATSGTFTSELWIDPAKQIHVFCLMGNVQNDEPVGGWDPDDYVPKSNHGERMNRVSIVCALAYNGVRHVICGDATYATMAGINRAFAGYRLVNVAMLTLPHHGSRRTTLDVEKGKVPNDNAVKGVERFSKLVSGQTTTASAYLKHSHPSQQIINLFDVDATTAPVIKDTRLQANRHELVAFFDVDAAYADYKAVVRYYHGYESDMNAFSTAYTIFNIYDGFSYNCRTNLLVVGAPTKWTLPAVRPFFNWGACWVYIVTAEAAGKWSLLGAGQLPATTGATGTIFTAPVTTALVSCRGVASDPPYVVPWSEPDVLETDSATLARTDRAPGRPPEPSRAAASAVRAGLSTRAPTLGRMRVLR